MKKKAAVFTIVKDELYFLPRWIKHYQKSFGNEDIYILDHNSTDGSTKDLSVNVIQVNNTISFDHDWLVNQVQNFQQDLLQKYECVLFSEVDEFVYTVEQPLTKLIEQFINDVDINYLTTNTYDLVQSVDNKEFSLNEQEDILSKRSYWIHNPNFGKTLLSKIPLNWSVGFHTLVDKVPCYKYDLFMLHLHKWDFKLMCKRTFRIKNWTYIDDMNGWHNKLKTYEELFDYFVENRENSLTLMDEKHKKSLKGL